MSSCNKLIVATWGLWDRERRTSLIPLAEMSRPDVNASLLAPVWQDEGEIDCLPFPAWIRLFVGVFKVTTSPDLTFSARYFVIISLFGKTISVTYVHWVLRPKGLARRRTF